MCRVCFVCVACCILCAVRVSRCISRQLWWGHRIPAYYFGKGENDFVKTTEVKETKKHKKEELQIEVEEEEVDIQNYANLTGMPFKDDCLLEVHPVCAPYSSLLKYKFKIKIIPGTMKKGKVMKLASDLFCCQSDMNEVKL